MERLQGRVALVTGAAQGIGAGIATAFARAGADLFVADIQVERVMGLAQEIGAVPIVLDVASPAGWDDAKSTIEAARGKVDILVHNAGVELVKPVPDTSLDEWRKVMAVNVDAPFIGSRALLPLLVAAGSRDMPASVINISSIAGLVGFPNQAAYNTSKGAIRHFTKSLAIEWAAHGYPIRVNSIHPGCIRTPMLEMAVEGWVREGSVPADDPWAAVAALCPLNSVGAPEDIAMGAVYLASNESRFVTGIELVIDGGWIAR